MALRVDTVDELPSALRAPALKKLGWNVNTPDSTFYVWAHTPRRHSSVETVSHIIENAQVLCTPGTGFGPAGEGYIRFALTAEMPRMEEAIKRLSKLSW